MSGCNGVTIWTGTHFYDCKVNFVVSIMSSLVPVSVYTVVGEGWMTEVGECRQIVVYRVGTR